MTTNKKLIALFTFLYIITAIALIFGIYAIYNLVAVEKPWTVGTTYLNKLTYTENKNPIFTVNVRSNENNNGEKITELLLNSYNDVDAKTFSGFGIQCIGDFEYLNNAGKTNIPLDSLNSNKLFSFLRNKNLKVVNETCVVGEFYFYKTGDDGKSFYKINYEEIPTNLLIDINGTFYSIRLKEYKYTTKEYSWWDFGHVFGTEITKTSTYTWFEVFDTIMKSAKTDTNIEDYFEFSLTLFDLSDFLEITYKDDKGQYHPLEDTTETKVINNIPTTYSKNGATDVKDSAFKSVKNQTSWNFFNNTTVKDFWGAEINQKVTEKELNYIHYSAYNGYFLTIDAKYSNYLKTLNGVDVVIDLANKTQYNLMGIDLQNFDFKINTLIIKNATQDFLLLNTEKCSVTPNIIGTED